MSHTMQSKILATPIGRERFPNARLLDEPEEVERIRQELPPNLLPFMVVEQSTWTDVFAFDRGTGKPDRVVVWAGDAIVMDWDSLEAFVDWIGRRPPADSQNRSGA